MNRPVYRSLAESFRLDIYLPECGLIAPPTATCRADERLDERMTDGRPPQSVLIDLTGGDAAETLEKAMRAVKGRAVPIVYFENAETGETIAAFAKENNIGDMTLCAPYEKRGVLARIRKLLPLSRGMLDLRGQEMPEFVGLIGECQRNEATMLLTDSAIDRELVRRLQKRFVQVWVEEDGNLAQALLTGACGVLTQRTGELYDLIGKFPAGASARPAPLYAHKTWHITGEYPENSVKGCAAAGRLEYDAAEIDVQLTKDDVMVVHHDWHTRNLFTEDRVVSGTDWDELKALRRKSFPEDGLDTMDELMREMKAYPETPVLIEIKTPAHTFGVEEMTRQLKELLAREDVQQACTLIMGVMPPYLAYVHEALAQVPCAHCTCVKEDAATDSMDENNLRIYKFAMETRGANAGFNPYHPMISGMFTRLAHVRGITVFPWTWAWEPWEDGREAITASFLQGHDGLTSDWVGKFWHVPVEVRASLPETWAAGEKLPVRAEALLRGAGWTETNKIEIVPLTGQIEVCEGGLIGKGGRVQLAIGVWTELEGGKKICVLSPAYEIDFAGDC